jgi:hypothetical protein
VVASCAVDFVPVLFAGIISAPAFRDSRSPEVDFGSNIGGVIVGGLRGYPRCNCCCVTIYAIFEVAYAIGFPLFFRDELFRSATLNVT